MQQPYTDRLLWGSTSSGSSSNNNNDPPSSNSNHNNGSAVGLLEIAVLLFLAFVVVKYVLGRLVHHCRRWWNPDYDAQRQTSSANNHTISVDTGIVSRKARLAGLTLDERKVVLQTLLETNAFSYKDRPQDDDIETGVVVDKPNSSNAETKNEPPKQDQDKVVVLGGLPGDDHEEDNTCCSICLNAYQDNDQVLTGAYCSHLFHKDCAEKWLLTKHNQDHCPYCRAEMLCATQWRSTCLQVLGAARVEEMTQQATTSPQDDDSTQDNTDSNGGGSSNNSASGEEPNDDGEQSSEDEEAPESTDEEGGTLSIAETPSDDGDEVERR